jgi:hypothetical protein
LRALPCTRKYTTSDDFQVKDDSIGRDALCPSAKIQKHAAFGIKDLLQTELCNAIQVL